MTTTRLDNEFLTPALKRTGVALLVAGAIFAATEYAARDTEATRRNAEAQLADERTRFLGAGTAQRVLRTYEGRFYAMRDEGIIDDDPRLAWAEAVQRSADTLAIPSVKFALEPTEPFDAENPTANAFIASNRMGLVLEVVHEGQLLDFLARLRATAPGLFWTRRCDLDLGDRQHTFTPQEDNLSAQCEIQWLTVHSRPLDVNMEAEQ